MRTELTYVGDMPGTVLTAEELFRSTFPDKRVELVRGRLVVREPPGYQHGLVIARLTRALMNHVAATDLGDVLAGDAGFKLSRDPDTVRGPDVAFISRARVPRPTPIAFAPLAPDLVIEVLSPSDHQGEALEKVADWLNAGTRLVWVIDPLRQQARVYRINGTLASLDADGTLEGEDVLPGFICPLSAVL